MKHYFKHVCLIVVIALSSNIFSQDLPTSFGPAPLSNTYQAPFTGNYDQVGSRYWSQLSTTPTFQFGKSFLETCTITNIGTAFPITFPGGLVNRGGTIYTWNQSAPFQLWSIDTVTGVHTLVFNMTGVPQSNFTGMTWDGTTMYGVSSTISVSQIFTINMTTGVCTPLGSPSSTCAAAIFLASRLGANYSLFSVDIVLDNLYKWNKTTGVPTLVGPIGGNANFGQDAQFDSRDGKLYWFAYTTGPALRSLDTTNGSNIQLCTFAAQATGIAVSEPGASGPLNCNYTWAAQTSGTTSLLQAVWTVNNNVVWAAGAAATVRKSTDGGTTWTNANPNPGVITGDIYNIYALDANTALCTTSPNATFIYRTTNGGTNWTQVFTQPGGFIDAIIMKDANNGFAYGDPVSARWSLWKTANGGATWDSTGLYLPQAGTEAGWNNAMSVVGNDIWFGTNNTRVYHSTNFGATGSWSFSATTGTANTYGVWFTNATTGMCVGTIAMLTTNGGTTWTPTGAVGGTGNMTSVGGYGSNFWLTRGGTIQGTTNLGTSWAQAYTGTPSLWATNIAVINGACLAGWSTGASGAVIKLNGIPVGISSNNNEIPSNYKLEQNYPNPFNPTTTIKFSIPTSGNVELKIYDLVGREVTVLVNEFKTTGNYSVDFDASNIASGVYFYTIKSGDFVDTKKMALIK